MLLGPAILQGFIEEEKEEDSDKIYRMVEFISDFLNNNASNQRQITFQSHDDYPL